jgi:hypothetical protein
VFFELSGVLYLYRDFVTVCVKIAAAVTLMDKIKREVIHYSVQQHLWIGSRETNPQKWRKQTHWI